MVDLDPPTPQAPTEAQIRHFLGGNFNLGRTNSRGVQLLSNSTPAISEFLQPTPPAGSDPHRYYHYFNTISISYLCVWIWLILFRYVFLLFQQPAGFNQQMEISAVTPIENFNISQFAIDVGLGNPLGGTFIRVGPDSSEWKRYPRWSVEDTR